MISPVLSHGIAISWSIRRMNLEAGQASAGGMTRRHWTTAGLSWGVVQLSCFRLVIHRGINVSTYIEMHKYMEWIKTYYTISGGMNIWISIYQLCWVHQGFDSLPYERSWIDHVCLSSGKYVTLKEATHPCTGKQAEKTLAHLTPVTRQKS